MNEQQENGHGKESLDEDPFPLPWPDPPRLTPLRKLEVAVTGYRARRETDREQAPAQAASPMFLRWFVVISFLLVQLVGFVWWASALSTKVAIESEYNKREMANIIAKYNRLLEYEGVVQLYESKIREMLVQRGVKRNEIPDPPQLPQD